MLQNILGIGRLCGSLRERRTFARNYARKTYFVNALALEFWEVSDVFCSRGHAYGGVVSKGGF